MEKIFLSVFIVLITLSCKKETNEPSTSSTYGTSPTNPTNPTNNGTMEFYVDNVKKIGTTNNIAIHKVEGFNYHFLLQCTSGNPQNGGETVFVSISNDFILKDTSYLVSNSSGVNSNSITYMIESAPTWSNGGCSAIHNNGVDLSAPGFISITNIDQTNKLISGTIEMQLCSNNTTGIEFKNIKCVFSNYKYTLTQ